MRVILLAALIGGLPALSQHAVPPDLDPPPPTMDGDPLASLAAHKPADNRRQEWEYKTVHTDKELNQAAAEGWELVTMASDQQGHAAYALKRHKGDTPPVVVEKQEPQYTRWAFKKRIQGDVLLSLTITSLGTPKDISIINSLDPGLDQSALETAKQWRFRPSTHDGQPADSKAQIVVHFRIISGEIPRLWFFYIYR